jgi:hypothetical protein
MSGALPLLSLNASILLPNRPIGAIRSTDLPDLQANDNQYCLGEFSKNTTVDMKIAFLWDVTQSSFVDIYTCY